MTNKTKAKKIADRILMIDCTGVRCNRIALKSGRYPDKEKDEGGLCRVALEKQIEDALTKLDASNGGHQRP